MNADLLERSVLAFLAAEDAETSPIPDQIAVAVQEGSTTLQSLVKGLGTVLVSDDDTQRGRGIRLLARVVDRLPNEGVNRQEVRTLTDFFCADSTLSPGTLVDALEGLIALAACTNFGLGDTIQVCKALFANVQMTSHVQATRFRVFTLLDLFMAHHRRALKRMGDDFLTGYCALASGEKDPRNLRLAFSIDRVILIEFDIANKVEDLFDITFCYFPITFTPPPGDPYGITSEDLQSDLRQALASTPRFGPLAIPLVLDKLQASSPSAKRQSLLVFAEAFPVYGKAICEHHAKILWEALVLEIYHATNADFEALSFAALRSLLITLYPDDDSPAAAQQTLAINGDGDDHMHQDDALTHQSPPVTGLAVDVCDHCLQELQEADKSNAKSATKVLGTMITISQRLASYVLPKVLEQMLLRFRSQEQRTQRSAVLAVIGAMLAAVRSRSAPYPPALSSFGDELLSVLTSALKAIETRPQALAAIVQLAQIPHFLAPAEIDFVVQNMIALVVDEDFENAEASVDDSLEGIAAVAVVHPRAVDQYALPPLISRLPDQGPTDLEEISKVRNTLSSLARTCLQPDLFEALSVRVLSRIERAAAITDASASDHLFVHLLLSTLRIALEKKASAGDSDLPKFIDRVVPGLFAVFLAPALRTMDDGRVATDSRLLEDAGRIMTIIVQSLDEKGQGVFAAKLRSAYYGGDLSDLLGPRTVSEAPFRPLTNDAPPHQANTIILYVACMIPTTPRVIASAADLSAYVDTLARLIIGWSHDLLVLSGARLLASIVNKRSAELGTFLDTSLPLLWREQIEVGAGSETQARSIRTVAWIARGLIVAGDARGYMWVTKLIDLFPRTECGRTAARSLGVIVDDGDGLLTAKNNAVIKRLYKQRFFSTILAQILRAYRATSPSEQHVYLVALAVLLRHTPQSVALAELPNLMPLLLRAIDLDDADLRANVIDALATLAPLSAEALTPHATAIVSLLLANSLQGTTTTRVAALRCLAVIPSVLPYVSLHAQKPVVLRELTLALDDKKKSVRREAVDARAMWFTFTSSA